MTAKTFLPEEAARLFADPAIAALRAALDGYVPADGAAREEIVEDLRRLVLSHLPDRVLEPIFTPADRTGNYTVAVRELPAFTRYMAFSAVYLPALFHKHASFMLNYPPG